MESFLLAAFGFALMLLAKAAKPEITWFQLALSAPLRMTMTLLGFVLLCAAFTEPDALIHVAQGVGVSALAFFASLPFLKGFSHE